MPWTAAHQAFPFFTISQSLFKLMFIELLMPSNHLVICCPLLILASVFPSIGVLSIVSALCIRWLKYWSFSFSISPSSVYLGLTGLISLLSKRLSRVFSNTTIQKNQFFGAQPSLWFNSHIHTWLLGKIIALTRWTFVCKVMSPLFNILSRFVKTFLPRSKTPWCHCQNQRTGLHADVIFTLRNRQYLMYPLIIRATSARVCQLDTIF